MFPSSTITIVSNSDEKFFPGLAVAVASALAAASGKYNYEFLILDGGLSEESLKNLRDTTSKIAECVGIQASISRLAIDQTLLASLPERRGSRMTYAKLILPEILAHLDSIIYLDADVLCYQGIEAVHPPLGETSRWLLAGVRDYFSVIEKDCPWIDQVPAHERKLPYINCGVMWMNLAELRKIGFTHKAISARAAIGNARQGDQSVFNFLCRGRAYVLPASINHCTSIGSNAPLCNGDLDLNIHFIGSPKPWLGAAKTSNWLACQLWYQAQAAIFPTMTPSYVSSEPADKPVIRYKSWIYLLMNPYRAADYRSDLHSLMDPKQVISRALKHWRKSCPFNQNL